MFAVFVIQQEKRSYCHLSIRSLDKIHYSKTVVTTYMYIDMFIFTYLCICCLRVFPNTFRNSIPRCLKILMLLCLNSDITIFVIPISMQFTMYSHKFIVVTSWLEYFNILCEYIHTAIVYAPIDNCLLYDRTVQQFLQILVP